MMPVTHTAARSARELLGQHRDDLAAAIAEAARLRDLARERDPSVTVDALVRADLERERLELSLPAAQAAADAEALAEQEAEVNSRLDACLAQRNAAVTAYNDALTTARSALHAVVASSHDLELLVDDVELIVRNMTDQSLGRRRVHSVGQYAQPIVDGRRFEKPTCTEDVVKALFDAMGDVSTSAYRSALTGLSPIAANSRPIA